MRALALLALLLAGCSAPFDPAAIPAAEHVVLVKSARLPDKWGPLVSRAHHAWFEFKDGPDRPWERLEVLAQGAIQFDDMVHRRTLEPAEVRRGTRWEHPVHLLSTLEGAPARRAIGALRRTAREYEAPRRYFAWPGPNSNSFVERLLRRCPELHAELHHNSVGKDWTLLDGGLTGSGTGVALDLPLLGIQLGLDDGVQLHVLGLVWGVDLWPPALLLPFLPRLGCPQHGAW
ncbi:MAG: DUF3750 domain-containing protein [Planctomycetota bacterium]